MSLLLHRLIKLKNEEVVAYWQESFLPGYLEVVFYYQTSQLQAIRVVPASDPRAEHLGTCAAVIAEDVRKLLMRRLVTDHLLLSSLNLKSGRKDTVPWWGPIILRNRQVRAEREARELKERFTTLAQINGEVKARVADLINKELIDLIHFEFEAGTPDKQGHRLSLADLSKKRQHEIQDAVANILSQRSHMNLVTEGQNSGLRKSNEDSSEREKSKGNTPRELEESSETLREVSSFDPSGNVESNINEAKQISEETLCFNTNAENTLAAEPQFNSTATVEVQAFNVDNVKAPVTPQSSHHLLQLPEMHQDLLLQSPLPVTIPDQAPQSATLSEGSNIANIVDIPTTTTQPAMGQATDLPTVDQAITPPVHATDQAVIQAVDSMDLMIPQPDNTMYQATTISSHKALPTTQPPIPEIAAAILALTTATESFGPPSLEDMVSTAVEHTLNNASMSPSVPSHPAIPHGWNNIKWAYRTHTAADFELQRQGLWLYDRPGTLLSHQSSERRLDLPIQPRITVVRNDTSVTTAATPSLLCNADTLVLNAHQYPWPGDQRWTSENSAPTPDSLFDTRLAEYQALEAAGIPVWRHDRNHLPCRNPACTSVLSDMVASTLTCTGCGPKSYIRYCSPDCFISDLYRHSQECGLDQFLITAVIDDATAPPRFSRLMPGIRERNGLRNFALHRQRVHAQATGGRYTLFNPVSGEPTTLYFDYQIDVTGGEAPYPGYLGEMEARIERCLNIAFFDHTQTLVVEYLARLIQQCLYTKGAPSLTPVLANQLTQEFNYNGEGSWRDLAVHPLCECEWAGDEVVGYQHVAGCVAGSQALGEVFRGGRRCLKNLVGAMEAKHWILRAWRTQHPTESDGQRRVMGYGFPGCAVPAGWMPKLGRGWRGIWSGEDDMAV